MAHLEEEEEVERDELDRQIRTSKALQVMQRELQLPAAVVMPVLLKLLKTFDGKWGHIEDENYRLLADAIFQQMEAAEAEKAPGSSSGGGRKPGSGKKKAVRASPRSRAPRNCKRAEVSDDDDESDRSQELIRRSKRTPADAFTHAAGMASLERAVTTKRGRRQAEVDDDEPAPLAILAPPSRVPPAQRCQEPAQVRRRVVQSVTAVTTMDRGTQTEKADFVALEPIAPTAMVCYEPMAQCASPDHKQEQQVQIPINQAVQVRCGAAGKLCHKCEKPKAAPVISAGATSLKFDPSRVKVEGEATASFLNPAPLQVMVPTSPPRLAVMEPPVQQFEVQSPEPLLLTFQCKDEGVGGEAPEVPVEVCSAKEAPVDDQVPEVAVPCSVKASVCELPKVLMAYSVQASIAEPSTVFETVSVNPPIAEALVPSSVTAAIAEELVPSAVTAPIAEALVPCSVEAPPIADTLMLFSGTSSIAVHNAASSLDTVSDVVVENPLKEVKKELSSKVEVEVKAAESVEVQHPTENSITESALAALTSYISASDNEDTNMSPKLASSTVEGIEESVEEGLQGVVLPLANASPIAVLLTNTSTQTHPPGLDTINAPGSVPALNSNHLPQDAANPSSSSESSKKRKRQLVKKHGEQESDEEQNLQRHSQESHEDQQKPPRCLQESQERKQRYDRSDISRGKEKVPISLSAPATFDLPPDFLYITASVIYQDAHVGISLARIGEDDRCSSCAGDCLDNRAPCECTRLTTGEYAYTADGRLFPHFLEHELDRRADSRYLAFCQPGACPVERSGEEDQVCKGHVQRRFIKECWEKCGCDWRCGNRIVQRGIARELQIFWTECGKGWGVRTLEHLPAGTFVCEYVGEILTNHEMWCRNNDVHRTAKHHFALQLDADWSSEKILKDEEALCLDGTFYGNIARFINHRCHDSNLIEIPVEIESPDHHYYHLAFFTSKDVNKNEELTWDYQLDFNDKDHQLQAFQCFCGSPFCRGKVEDGKPWV